MIFKTAIPFLIDEFTVEENETYIVTINDTAYTCTAFVDPDVDLLRLGNGAIDGWDSYGDDVPFIMRPDGGYFTVAIPNVETLTVQKSSDNTYLLENASVYYDQDIPYITKDNDEAELWHPIEEGKNYLVTFNGDEYKCTAQKSGGYVFIGSPSLDADLEIEEEINEPFCVVFEAPYYWNLYTEEVGMCSMSVVGIEYAVIHQIDKKYSPQADWEELDSESNTYIQNRPFGTIRKVVTLVDNLTAEDYNDGNYPAVGNLIVDAAYTVIFNGETFENVVCQGEAGDYQYLEGNYPFYVETYGEGAIYISGEDFETITIIGPKDTFVKIGREYLPEGGVGYTEESDTIIPATTLTGFRPDEEGSLYYLESNLTLNLTYGKTYKIIWDGVEYYSEYKYDYIGFKGADPFIIYDYGYISTTSTNSEHTVEIIVEPKDYQIDEKYLPIF